MVYFPCNCRINKNAAVLVKEEDAKSSLINQSIALINNVERLIEISKNCKSLALPNSTSVIANEVLKLANYNI